MIMTLIDGIMAPLAALIDRIIPDPHTRNTAKLELLRLQGSHEMQTLETQIAAVLAEAKSADPWTSRARPGFLYVMYAIILWAIPMGLISAISPGIARDIADGMNRYLTGIPDAIWGLFGTGYLGYTAARQWGKFNRTDK
jgi:hypothetical protein